VLLTGLGCLSWLWCADSADAARVVISNRQGTVVFDKDYSCRAEALRAHLDAERTNVVSNLNLTGWDVSGSALTNVTFSKVVLRGADFSRCRLEDVGFTECDLGRAFFVDAVFVGDCSFTTCQAPEADFARIAVNRNQSISFDHSKLDGAGFTQATIDRGSFLDARLFGADFSGAGVQWRTFLGADEAGLHSVRNELRANGCRELERAVTRAIEYDRTQLLELWQLRAIRRLLFDFTCAYGAQPTRPLALIVWVWGLATLCYAGCVVFLGDSGLLLTVVRARRRSVGRPLVTSVRLRFVPRRKRHCRLARPLGVIATLATAAAFSLHCAVTLKFQWFDAGQWLRMLQKREYSVVPYGWARTLSGVQSLLSLYLVAMWLISTFGRPFG